MIERQRMRANNIVLALLTIYSLGAAGAYLFLSKTEYIQVKVIAVIGLLFLVSGILIQRSDQYRKYFQILVLISFGCCYFVGLNLSGYHELTTASVVVYVVMLAQDRKYSAIIGAVYA